MKHQSLIRELKRKAMKNGGLTFTDRLYQSLVKAKPIKDVVFAWEGKELKAKEAA